MSESATTVLDPKPTTKPAKAPKPSKALSPDRASYNAAVTLCALYAVGRALPRRKPGQSLSTHFDATKAAMDRIQDADTTVRAGKPEWSLRCADGLDRSATALADYILRNDLQGRGSDLKAWAGGIAK